MPIHFLCPDQADDGLTWEGKEGRLFVYELLCKHLIELHSARGNQDLSAVPLHSGWSQDGGSEAEESVEQRYRSVGGYLRRQSPLTQLTLLDQPARLADQAGVQVLSERELQDLQRWLLMQHSCLSARYDDEVLPESERLALPGCGELLMRMLHHTAACLAHPQWELRRIAQQVLPCLCEVLCLYDVDLVRTVWGCVRRDSSLLSFLGLFSLHHSLTLCARVVATTLITPAVMTSPPPLSLPHALLVL
ncbi:hypothetical protein ACOMHN_002684 [Nucella lapillus]